MERFSNELYNDVIALSGKKFFFLTRQLVLTIAATIITYELVLIQFQFQNEVKDFGPCDSNITDVILD